MQSRQDPQRLSWNLLLGVGLTSLCTLMLQVGLIRLFSVSLWHHFAFMVVSTAFLGFAASGTFLMVAPRIKSLHLESSLAWLALGFSVAGLGACWSSNWIPFDPARIMWDPHQWLYLLGFYAVLAVPFFFAGLILALLYSGAPAAVNRSYAFDLAGAGLGCGAVLYVHASAGEVGTVLVICLIAGLASFSFKPAGRKLNAVRIAWVALLCLLFFGKPGFLALRISPYKALSAALRYPDARLLETRYGPTSRIDVVRSGAVRFAPGLSLEFQGDLPEQLGLCLDAGRLDAVTRFRGADRKMVFTEFLPAALPYNMVGAGRVLIMEPMGGLSVLTALHHGANTITTTHATPLVLRMMRGPLLAPFSGDLYGGSVLAVEEGGRCFLLGREGHYDAIQLPLTDTMGALSSGLYGLSEEYALTVEAFQTYVRALKDNGVLTVTRYLLPPPRHELRLVAVACAALRTMGIRVPGRHMAIMRSWGTFTLLVKRSPLGPEDIRRLKTFCHRLRFDLIHYPGMDRSEANQYNRFSTPLYHDMTAAILDSRQAEIFYDSYLFDVRPVDDDRPFFYHSFKVNRVVSLYRAVGDKWQLFLEGGYLVYLVLLQALVIAFVLTALPLSKKGASGATPFLGFFALVGMAFMLTEICLIQKFILFLARPVYAFSAVLFSVLLSSGLGSFCSRRVLAEREGGGGGRPGVGRVWILVLAPASILACAFFLDRLLLTALARPLWIRFALTFFVILPMGFVMGMFFPAGVRILSRKRRESVPWAWSVNASVSVVASVLAVVIALSWGFSTVLVLAAGLYALAALTLTRA